MLTLAAHGFHAICFNSETSVIPPKIIRKLVYRFKHIVLLYDVDRTGLEVKERTAKGYIRYMREKEIIEKEGDHYVHGQRRV